MSAGADTRARDGVVIRPAEHADAPAVADLTRRAFCSQAKLYEDDTLPPLADTAESVTAEMAAGAVVLVCESHGVIVGAIRGTLHEGCCHIARLVVEPALQGRGLGRRLTNELEARFPDAERFEIFTGHRSAPALTLYESLGYVRERVVPVHERLSLVFLDKAAPGKSRCNR